MKKIKTRNIIKKITCIIIVLILCNFIVPNITYGVIDAGPIFAPICKFITYLCDTIMELMQNEFISLEPIKSDSNKVVITPDIGASVPNLGKDNSTYNFQFSPAIIFSGTVPAFSINFINPGQDDRNINNMNAYIEHEKAEYMKNQKECDEDTYVEITGEAKSHNSEMKEESVTEYHSGLTAVQNYYYYIEDDNFYAYLVTEYYEPGATESTSYSFYKAPAKSVKELNELVQYKSIASELQPTVASWYNALRKVALVGLLSALVYIGIQIVITSASGKENSKYKKMLTDWLIALCLLFTLHYIMSITITVTNNISNILNSGKTDDLLNTLRNKIATAEDYNFYQNIKDFFGNTVTQPTYEALVPEVIMYVIMVIYTITFAIQYLKRVLYMAFFTLIAPLVALTYPLDKIKDSKAQAFDMWLKEYIYNALIQVVHLVLYYTLVGSALSLVEVYPLYGIIAILFMTQAERILRKMFGFNNSSTIGKFEAAAVGGLMLSGMKKMAAFAKPTPKDIKSDTPKNNNIRMASNTKK